MGRQALTDQQKAIVHDLKSGKKQKDIAEHYGVHATTVARIKSRYKDLIESDNQLQVYENYANVEKYEAKVINNLKSASISISNILKDKSWQQQSAPQLAKTLGIMIDKLRLLEGKSTSNVAHNVLHQLSPDDRKILQEHVGKLKHAFIQANN